ncbi:Uncharacterized protein ToN1_41770 [Aromatoleum petrolei]|nr:Uncharacterized protein ToN1_41770 [Aromatoleum petrolei]
MSLVSESSTCTRSKQSLIEPGNNRGAIFLPAAFRRLTK